MNRPVLTSPQQQIINAWHANALPWCEAVRNNQIASRVAVTNQAVVDACLQSNPQTGLDIGCGEGWLVRELANHSVAMTGVDAVTALIAAAEQLSDDNFAVLDYEQVSNGAIDSQFDLVVCNFSLFGDDDVVRLLAAIPKLLTPNGVFALQTLHPETACGDLPYQDGWRTGSWAGLGPGFANPPPWYFRTLKSWQNLITCSGLNLTRTITPTRPNSDKPLSVIFLATLP